MDFSNKTCIVTGGANGIGRCIVEDFFEKGANVAFIDVDQEAGSHVIATHDSERLYFFCGDITEESNIRNFYDQVLVRFPEIDYLINNACISHKGILSDCSYEDFNYVLKLGVSAPYLLTSLFLPHFQLGSSIVNISSTRAYMSQPDTESYSAAKGGISALTHALSISLAGKVRVNSVSPGWIDTSHYQYPNTSILLEPNDMKQHPAGRIGVPQDISSMVLYLCSEEASFISGENIIIDGGMSKQMIYHNDFGWKKNDFN